MVVSNLELPQEIQELADKHNFEVSVEDAVKQSPDFDYLSHLEVRLKSPQTEVTIGCTKNEKSTGKFQIATVEHGQDVYSEDDYPKSLPAIITAILQGGEREKRGLFGRSKKYVIDADGNTYWPRR